MESTEDEALPKQSKPTEIPSISSKDSVLSMPNLPAELITEILLKLPVKSLLQFRSVSISWLSLISSPQFVKTHLLLSASNKDYTHHGVMFKVASCANHGVTDCSLSALLNHPVTEAIDLDYPGKLVNGKLHWIETGQNISSIDLCNEKWAEIEKPCNFSFNDYGHFVLGVLGSDLSVFCNYTWGADIWVMKEYGVKESWTKMFTIKSPNDFMPRISGSPILLSNGDILLEIRSRLGKYNPEDDSIKYLDVTNFAPYVEAEVYVKSLVCPFLQK